MTVTEFTKLSHGNMMFAMVEAKGLGWMNERKIAITADKNVVREMFGDREVLGFEPKTGRTLYIYIK